MIGSRLRSLREKHQMTQERVSKELGVTRPAYTQYETGAREPDAATLAKLAEFFDVSIDFLITGENSMFDAKIDGSTKINKELVQTAQWLDALNVGGIPVGPIRQIPIVAEIPCGEPMLTEDNILGYHPVDTSLINLSGGEFVWVKAKGESMIGSNILDGSLVLLRLQPEVENGQIAAVGVDEENATLKRVFYVDGKVLLYPDNPTMKPMTYPNGRIRIVARAIRVSSEL